MAQCKLPIIDIRTDSPVPSTMEDDDLRVSGTPIEMSSDPVYDIIENQLGCLEHESVVDFAVDDGSELPLIDDNVKY
jgi:hypothetical protein